ncbi:hypothetical protein [Anditalea andensis]|uniref:Alpha-ketoglutarate decarboxylase n=1 Tax=Anditalea andensis TaxID=1048983 RepID=A0A074KYE2_9BACT|nr:hypothetical protein [Anditalea andensis]KEO75011.1 hypothetical protein EL17_04875 [Anditalea andensis]
MLLFKNKTLLYIFLILIIFISFESNAQRFIDPEENPPLKERMYYGGNFSLQFGSVTFIDISPLAGVMITDRYSAGLGATYQYINWRYLNTGGRSVYGGRIFNRYNITQNFFAHAEFESLNATYEFNQELRKEWIPSTFVGGGYFSPAGTRGGFNIMFLYNLMYDNIRSPYNEPYVIRVGFVF